MTIETMQANVQEVANLLKTMSHPARLQVLCQLAEDEVGVGELWNHSKLSQSAFSQHLAVLKKHKLIKARKSSQQVFYSLSEPKVKCLVVTLHKLFCQQP
ncbi:MAG: helix-turn-helix transcriptional regulator [Shewanella sp.]|nr:helix-turn-helix transcriptional regulator [Shewanella sp.]